MLKNIAHRKLFISKTSILHMVVNIVGVSTTDAEFSAPVPVYDAGMNLIGYARALGVSVNGNVTLVVDAFFKKPEGEKEYEEYMRLVRAVFEKGSGIEAVKKLFQLYKREVPKMFEVRRVNFEVTDPKLDMTLGVNGVRLHIVWDYETGRYSMFYLPPLDMVEELNTKIAHYLAITRGALNSLGELARLKAENRDLRSRVAILEDALSRTQSWIEDHVSKLGELQTNLLDMRLKSAGNIGKEELTNYLSQMKEIVAEMSNWSRENFSVVLRGREPLLAEEQKVLNAFRAVVNIVKDVISPSLSEDQVAEILAEVIAKNPEWIARQIERYRSVFSVVPPVEVAPPAEVPAEEEAEEEEGEGE